MTIRPNVRWDLILAPYAIFLGYEVRGAEFIDLKSPGAAGLFDQKGFPRDELQFIIGDVHVWRTERGWRVSRLIQGIWERPTPSDFHLGLKDALDEGARNWRDR